VFTFDVPSRGYIYAAEIDELEEGVPRLSLFGLFDEDAPPRKLTARIMWAGAVEEADHFSYVGSFDIRKLRMGAVALDSPVRSAPGFMRHVLLVAKKPEESRIITGH
jgi:hypothetical protein